MNGCFAPKSLKLIHQSTAIIREALKNHNFLTSLQCGHLLQALTASKCFKKALQLHAHMITCGVLIQNTYLNTKLCAMYAASGNMPAARVIFDGIVLKSSFLWNVMVRGYACNNCSLDSLVLYLDMLSFGRRADNFTYPFVLMACGHLLLVEVGERIHGEVVVSGFESDVYVANSLVSMYSKFGQMGIARNLFDRMPQRDLTSWKTMLSGYVKNGYPDVALSLLSLLSVSDVRMDRATLVGVLPACAALGAVKQGKEIHAYILRSSLEFDGFLANALIDVYVNSNFVIGARRLFERMSERDIISWNALISGCARHGDPMECLSLFCLMNSEGLLVADVITLIAVLGACDRTSALQFGRITHAYLIKRGFDKEIIVGTALIDMYAKCGSLACSCHAFDEMESKNLISWSAMVSGYGLHGKGKEAISCFTEMKLKGLRPDRVAFTSVLSACSHCGLVNEGKELFNQMSDENSIKPSIEHYSCMVDLLGRAGQLDEAYKLIMDMDIRPNADVWAALLSACHTHRNVELAEIAALHVCHLNPKRISPYVTLSNIYAVENRWTDVDRVRKAARRNGLRKPPGYSFVELNTEIHRFMVGDKSHPQSKSIYTMLNEIRRQLKETGYTPDTSSVFYDVADDAKEDLLWDHSEREIVVRDARRFHHFQNGSCSCGDYW
ncbi:pentatricopeptide repeat-containing protein At3g26782, mitochondrial-like [Dioscorea cayenensis subsp. rotundata]|uniref:Pentatricopeptide repeat-containing protein At3g26782, mitochondrial-like n=1 Tax=Dioscorea cayennensis subsp. rotundata TaxID=55577 RepID=A0AB40BSI8_DIOCR|nr:pentatricopeptide repeat-containing protein At3g26782, mitochondrial-like [Dioscorea cayenensis subsp. rotundata]